MERRIVRIDMNDPEIRSLSDKICGNIQRELEQLYKDRTISNLTTPNYTF